jgi:hypothetical protein
MRSLFYLPLLLLLSGSLFSDRRAFIDPTGTYLLKGEVRKNKIVGRAGELRVRLLNANTAAMCLYLSKGLPVMNPDSCWIRCIMEIINASIFRPAIRRALFILFLR